MTETKLVTIIDDDQDDLDIMQHVIRNIDPTIRCQSYIYPEEALSSLLASREQKQPDYLFIDINMPGVRGDTCLQIFRSNSSFQDTIIVMYSTSMPEHVASALKSSGADYVFEKPVRIKSYAEILGQILR